MSEFWRDIPGYEKIYQVSSEGRVKQLEHASQVRTKDGSFQYRTRPEKILTSSIRSGGYPAVTLRKLGKPKIFLIKRLVAEAFIPNPDNKPSVKLKDGDPMNNNISNLEWATAKEVSRSHLDDVHVSKMRVRCIELNRTFPSMSYAEKYLHLRKNGIRNSIKNGVGIGGYTFELIPNQKTKIKKLFDV